jgi:hypothetical protein
VKAADDKCAKCGAEIYSIGEGNTRKHFIDPPSGRRADPRTSVNLRALYVSSATTVEGQLTDVSITGGFFAAPISDSTGTLCDLVLRIVDDEEPLRIDAEVMRVSVNPKGMGLRFLRLTRAAQKWLISVGALEETK